MTELIKIFLLILCSTVAVLFLVVFVVRNLAWVSKEVVDYYLARKKELMLELEEELKDSVRPVAVGKKFGSN